MPCLSSLERGLLGARRPHGPARPQPRARQGLSIGRARRRDRLPAVLTRRVGPRVRRRGGLCPRRGASRHDRRARRWCCRGHDGPRHDPHERRPRRRRRHPRDPAASPGPRPGERVILLPEVRVERAQRDLGGPAPDADGVRHRPRGAPPGSRRRDAERAARRGRRRARGPVRRSRCVQHDLAARGARRTGVDLPRRRAAHVRRTRRRRTSPTCRPPPSTTSRCIAVSRRSSSGLATPGGAINLVTADRPASSGSRSRAAPTARGRRADARRKVAARVGNPARGLSGVGRRLHLRRRQRHAVQPQRRRGEPAGQQPLRRAPPRSPPCRTGRWTASS